MRKYEYRTTTGRLDWDDEAFTIDGVDDPVQPDGDEWELVSSAIGALRNSGQPILWFWRRVLREEK